MAFGMWPTARSKASASASVTLRARTTAAAFLSSFSNGTTDTSRSLIASPAYLFAAWTNSATRTASSAALQVSTECLTRKPPRTRATSTGINSTALRRLATGQLPVRDRRRAASAVGCNAEFGKIVPSVLDRLAFDAGRAPS